MFIKFTKLRWSFDKYIEEDIYIDSIKVYAFEKKEMNGTTGTMVYLDKMSFFIKETPDDILNKIRY